MRREGFCLEEPGKASWNSGSAAQGKMISPAVFRPRRGGWEVGRPVRLPYCLSIHPEEKSMFMSGEGEFERRPVERWYEGIKKSWRLIERENRYLNDVHIKDGPSALNFKDILGVHTL